MIDKRVRIEPIVDTEEKEKDTSFSVKVTSDSLNVRSTPNNRNNNNIVRQITDHGTYKITDEKDGFGKLEDGNWIMLTYTKRV